MDSHRIGLKELQERYLTNIQTGLTQQVVDLKLKKMKNVLQKITKKTIFIKFVKQLKKIYHLLILFASFLSFFLYYQNMQYQMVFFLFFILAFIFKEKILIYQKIQTKLYLKNRQLLETQKKYVLIHQKQKKNKKTKNIKKIQLVQGDIIKLNQDMVSPADIRILASSDLFINKTIYTGNKQEIYCHPECMNKENPLSTTNIIFLGCKITNGKALGMVIQTGTETLIQDLAYKCSQEDYFPDSQSKKYFDIFLNQISFASLGFGLLLITINIILQRDIGIENYLLFSIGILISTLPLGIIILKTLYIVIIERKLLQSKLQLNYRESLTALGQSTCICIDMTGVITINKFIVSDLWYDDKPHIGKNSQLSDKDEKLQYNIKKDQSLQFMMECAVLCNDAYFSDNLPASVIKEVQQNNQLNLQQKKEKLYNLQKDYSQELKNKKWIDWPCVGQENEIALLKFFQPLKDIRYIRKQQPIIHDSSGQKAKIQFSQQNYYSFVICSNIQERSYFTLYTKVYLQINVFVLIFIQMKGSPQVVWNMCDKIYDRGKITKKSNKWEIKFEKIMNFYGKNSYRVLAFSKLDLSKKVSQKKNQIYRIKKQIFKQNTDIDIKELNFPLNNQIFIGLVAFENPIKQRKIKKILNEIKQKVIKTLIQQNPDALTATQIAKKSHIITMKTQLDIQKDLNIPPENAIIDAQSLVIDGDQLAKQIIQEEGLPDKQKGKILENWLKKKEIIFTRIQPSHKVYIIKALKKLNHIIASTGKECKDSPYIRFSDVGISYGIQGDEIAKDSCDLILMEDSLHALSKGVCEGKLIYENLKKSISFILAASVPQIMAFVYCFLAAIPFALTPLQVLVIDLGIVHIPALFYVYLQNEKIGFQNNLKQVNKRMIVIAYFLVGFCSCLAGFLSFFMVLKDFGLSHENLLGILEKRIYEPLDGDEFDTNSFWLGNSLLKQNFPCQKGKDYPNQLGRHLDWIFHKDFSFDFRLALAYCDVLKKKKKKKYKFVE
ncbi:P-type alpha subunit family protein, putative [Ichthyophthirius multifiliis]|uniref:P-type alpha subunit family protein, putative n=1 Tax=Ichthyophthirius multifiliis TaxID=5932 RepID=G0QUA4_ICHMU|nr:P-type alpha subunit family protein, putative [Ichthyophthirius multifiliis]EGR31207.1 P-type alpha subunit family protein, putative [Ichthyophthirius multifiliis]|eukprot:XP_004034693.1 P-type alpha subunit family protein, putative [Ichthyophthirius multifiliis]